MLGYTVILDEGEDVDLLLEWESYTGDSFAATGWYRIFDALSGDEVKARTDITSCTSLIISLTPDEVCIIDDTQEMEKKIILGCLIYSTGKQKPFRQEYYVRRLGFVEDDGVT